jgi:integrase
VAVYWRAYKKGVAVRTQGAGVFWYSFVYAGKRVQESAKTTRKTIAVEAEKRRKLELQRALAGLPIEDRKVRISSVHDVVKIYREHYDINHRPQSVAFSSGRLAHIDRLLGPVLLPNLTEQRMRSYIKARLKDGACGRTINMEIGELSRAIGKTWRELWPRLRKLEERKDVGHALLPDEEARLLRVAAENPSPNQNPMLYTFIRVALATGMRSGEVIALTWKQIDVERNVITVGHAKTSSGTGRQIPINTELQTVLRDHICWFTERFGYLNPNWFVFPGRIGRPRKGVLRPFDPARATSTIKTAWASLRKKAGVRCRLHDLRHTAATKMAEAGVPESAMLSIMGHMSRGMLERYSHIRLAAKRDAVEALRTSKPVEPIFGVSTISTTVSENVTVQ